MSRMYNIDTMFTHIYIVDHMYTHCTTCTRSLQYQILPLYVVHVLKSLQELGNPPHTPPALPPIGLTGNFPFTGLVPPSLTGTSPVTVIIPPSLRRMSLCTYVNMIQISCVQILALYVYTCLFYIRIVQISLSFYI